MRWLLASEILRLRSRVGVVALLTAGVAFVALLMVGQVSMHEDDYEQARAAFRTERTAAYPDELASYRLTLASIGESQMPKGHREVTVAEYVDGVDFTGATTPVPSRRFVSADITPEMVKLASVLLCIVAFLAGATAGGAEWQQRTIHGLLTWESRRARVFAAKALALAVVTVTALLLAQLSTLALGQVGGMLRGTTEGTDGGWWLEQLGSVARGAIVVVLSSCAGISLAFLGRLTAFALGVGIVYVGVVESLVLGVRPALEPYTIRGAMSAFLDGGSQIILPNGEAPPIVLVVTSLGALVTVLAYAALTTAAATASFVRRDVA